MYDPRLSVYPANHHYLPGMRLRRGAVRCLCATFGLAAAPIRAQEYTRPELHWETIHTTHFDVHFPRVMRPWAIHAAGRLEGVHDAVVALVGSGPARTVTVVIDDPYNVSNGASLPFLDAPTIVLWPTPPEPTATSATRKLGGGADGTRVHAHRPPDQPDEKPPPAYPVAVAAGRH